MYRWHRLKKLILGRGGRPREVAPVDRPPAARVPSRRALQAELLALDRLGRRDPA